MSAADTMAAEALSFAAAAAVYRPESTGAWLRLHTPPKPSATHEDMGDDEEWEKRPHLDAPDPWDDSKWKEGEDRRCRFGRLGACIRRRARTPCCQLAEGRRRS